MCDMSAYSTDMFIFIDETGSDNRNALRKYGYSLRGNTPVSHALLVRGERASGIACMSNSGLLDVQTIIGTSDGDIFYKFVHTNLQPHLMPFNGTNPHCFCDSSLGFKQIYLARKLDTLSKFIITCSKYTYKYKVKIVTSIYIAAGQDAMS